MRKRHTRWKREHRNNQLRRGMGPLRKVDHSKIADFAELIRPDFEKRIFKVEPRSGGGQPVCFAPCPPDFGGRWMESRGV